MAGAQPAATSVWMPRSDRHPAAAAVERVDSAEARNPHP